MLSAIAELTGLTPEEVFVLCLGAVLFMPHAYYAIVWTRPDNWKALVTATCGSSTDPMEAFFTGAVIGKIAQFAAVVAFGVFAVGEVPEVPPVRRAVFAAVLFATGQWLNASMIHAIGKAGVYYGTKLGHDIPWCTSFPFNCVIHPQYVGSVLSILGVALAAHCDSYSHAGMWSLVWFWVGGYVSSGIVEQFM